MLVPGVVLAVLMVFVPDRVLGVLVERALVVEVGVVPVRRVVAGVVAAMGMLNLQLLLQ